MVDEGNTAVGVSAEKHDADIRRLNVQLEKRVA